MEAVRPDVPQDGLLEIALREYGVRILDNIDLSRVDSVEGCRRIVGRALMERGDARAFVLGRKLIAA